MTLEQFFTRLRKTPRTWEVDPFGCLRNGRSVCPLVEGAGIPGRATTAAGKKLGFSCALTWKIADSVDAVEPYDHRLRARLLRACGVAERRQDGG